MISASESRIGLWLLAAFVSVGAVAQSREPPETTGQQIGPQTQQPGPVAEAPKEDKRGTDEMPLVIKNYPQQSQQSTAEAEDDRREKADTDAWTVRIGKASIVVGGLTFLILIGQTIVFGRQARRLKETIGEMKTATLATEKVAAAVGATVKKMDETAQRQLRAYVFLELIDFGEPASINLSNYTKPLIKLRNSGLTPAKNVIACCNQCLDKIPDNFDYPDGSVLHYLDIGPQSSLEMQDLSIPIGHINHVANHEYYWYIYGWVDYEDVFSRDRHRTEFCCGINAVIEQNRFVLTKYFTGPFNGSDNTSYREAKPYEQPKTAS